LIDDQATMPIVSTLRSVQRQGGISFGAPGHHQGRAAPPAVRTLLADAFKADILTPKGLDERTEPKQVLQRAHALAAEAWGADLCRFATGGTTQSLHTALAAVAHPGDTVLLAQNAHKAEFAGALFMGLDVGVIPVTIDRDWDLEHGVDPAALTAAFASHPDAKAVVVVSPSYHGVTSDIAALASVAHACGVPLIVDAAWGGAFAFSSRLPQDALAAGADIMVTSVHKTMGALGQGSAMFVKGLLVDPVRFALAYELFETTSPSVPILASLDAARSAHATNGEKMWGDVLDMAAHARAELAAIPGVRVFGREHLDGAGAHDLNPSAVTLDIAALHIAGYAADDWLQAEYNVTVGLSDARHLAAIISPGNTSSEIARLVRGVRGLARAKKRHPERLLAAPALPHIDTLTYDPAMRASEAFAAPAELVAWEAAAGRIAAEIVAPAPPGVPRLIPGQRITQAHVEWLVANRDAACSSSIQRTRANVASGSSIKPSLRGERVAW